MPHDLKASLAIDSRDVVGESPAWDAAQARLLWVDLFSGIVHEARPDSERRWLQTRRWNFDRPVSAVMPRTQGGLVVVGGIDIFIVDEAGGISPFVSLDEKTQRVAINDAKCDPRGRLWVGTHAHDLDEGGGALYRIAADGTATKVLDNVIGTNGLDWSPDGSTFYYVDSLKFTVDAFDFDMTHGTVSNRRNVVTIKQGEGMPDGMTVDREGCLWVAVAGTGAIWRYAPDGTVLARIETSAPCVTSCAFGGTDGCDLFITSASRLLPDSFWPALGFDAEKAKASASAPGAGGIFIFRPGVRGAAATPFAG